MWFIIGFLFSARQRKHIHNTKWVKKYRNPFELDGRKWSLDCSHRISFRFVFFLWWNFCCFFLLIFSIGGISAKAQCVCHLSNMYCYFLNIHSIHIILFINYWHWSSGQIIRTHCTAAFASIEREESFPTATFDCKADIFCTSILLSFNLVSAGQQLESV